MALALCPFCESGLPWNACVCVGARFAQRHGMIAARKEWLTKSGGSTTSEPVAKTAGARRRELSGARATRVTADIAPAVPNVVLPEPSATETEKPKRKRAPRGTFDRIAYQREYMRRRRAQKGQTQGGE